MVIMDQEHLPLMKKIQNTPFFPTCYIIDIPLETTEKLAYNSPIKVIKLLQIFTQKIRELHLAGTLAVTSGIVQTQMIAKLPLDSKYGRKLINRKNRAKFAINSDAKSEMKNSDEKSPDPIIKVERLDQT